MSIDKIEKIYPVLLVGGVLFRVISALFTVNGKTGFIDEDFYITSILLSVLALLCVIAAVIASFSCNDPSVRKGTPGIFTGIFSFLISALSVIDIVNMRYSDYFPNWQISLVGVVGIINAAFFLYLAVACFFKLKVPSALYAVPLIFSIVRLIRFFAVSSSITIITDNVFGTLCYAAAVIFMMEFAIFKNNFEANSSPKKLLASGVSASMLSVISTLPRIIKLAVDKTAVAHESVYSIALSLAMGLFIMSATFGAFKKIK